MTVIKELVEALEEVIIRCRECSNNIAMWEWDDCDGVEYLCDEHKHDNFYIYGPEEIKGARNAQAVLEKAKQYLEEIG